MTQQTIRELNDAFRTTFRGGRVVMTQGVAEMPSDSRLKLLISVQDFNDFSEDNDPHGEHDFGSIDHEGTTYFWEIDYYAPDMEHGSEDPADTAQTVRVLTLTSSPP